jgi:hypothetical protein
MAERDARPFRRVGLGQEDIDEDGEDGAGEPRGAPDRRGIG